MSIGTSSSRQGSETGRFTTRRLRSALSLWRASLRSTDVVIAGIVFAISLGLGAYLLTAARKAAQIAFADRAQRLQAALVKNLQVPFEDLASLGRFFEAEQMVTRRTFRLLTSPLLLNHRAVYAFEWLPAVPADERPALEAEARAAGLTEYRFWEMGEDRKPREASARALYAPIHYMEPPSARAVGFDVASDPDRWATAELARDSGKAVASRPFRLVEDLGDPAASPAVAIYAPLYRDGDPGSPAGRRAALTGFLNAIYRVAPVADSLGGDASGLGFALRDAEARGAPTLAERPREAERLPRRRGFDVDFPVRFADRAWLLEVFALPGAFVPSRRGAIDVASLGGFAALLGLVTSTAFRTISRLRRQAEKVGPYRLVARLGQGAMGVVWEARHALLRRPTAVKLLAPGTEGERSLARFEREVQLTAGLTHPSTIAIYDYGRTADGVFYYAMELLRGINLQQLIAADGPVPPARAVHLLRQACGALSEAHAAGLIHRDIKPANVMLCVYGGIPDFLKILDFGLVKDIGGVEPAPAGNGAASGDASLSQDGSLLGTPLYMAPEGMSDPAGLDARADVFALGALGYYLLTGNSPFPGRTALEVFRLAKQGPPPLAGSSRHPVPACLEETLRRCLAFRREDRPASAEELDAMLEACVISPPWRAAEAKAWWRERGPAVLAAAQAEREEVGKYLSLPAASRGGIDSHAAGGAIE